MPHFVIEYSANVGNAVRIDAVVEAVRTAAIETGIFPVGGIRVRAYPCAHYAIADGDPAHGFVAMTLRLAEGRTLEARKRAGDGVFSALNAALAPAFARMTLAVSFEIGEIPTELSWKNNTIHAALQKRGAA